MKKENIEQIIMENLMKNGLSRAEASTEAYNYLVAWRKGEVEPETMRALGVDTTKCPVAR